MNNIDKKYQELLQDILDNGVTKQDRTGTGTVSVFGRQIRHDMKDGFPLLTTKKMPFKTIVTELLWFLRGDTNIKYLVDNGCHIWDGDAYKNYLSKYKKDLANGEFESKGEDSVYIPDPNTKYGKLRPYTQEEFINKIKTDDEFANKWGELGPVYGKQWRSWTKFEEYDDAFEVDILEENEDSVSFSMGTSGMVYEIDQIANLINDLKTNPDSRRLMVNAWNVGELDQMVLPPCHYGFQVYTRELSFDEFWDRLTPKQRGTMEKPYEGETYNGIDSRIEFKNIASEIHNLPTRAISLMWSQRSVDSFLGLPFNIASYGLLLEIIAKEVNMVPDELIGNLGDVHLYSNHIEQAKEQIGRELTNDERFRIAYKDLGLRKKLESESKMLRYPDGHNKVMDDANIPTQTREPFQLPKLGMDYRDGEYNKDLTDFIPDDFYLVDYQSHPSIKAPLSN